MTGFILDHRSQKTGAVEEVPHGRDSLVAAIAATASKVCPVRGTTISPDLRRSSGPGGSTGVSSNRLPTRANRSTDPDFRFIQSVFSQLVHDGLRHVIRSGCRLSRCKHGKVILRLDECADLLLR